MSLHRTVDGFFEKKAIKGQKTKQPYAIAMKDGAPFGIAGIGKNWKESASGEWVRTLQSSPPMPMSWWPISMTGCRSFWRRVIMPAGLAMSLAPRDLMLLFVNFRKNYHPTKGLLKDHGLIATPTFILVKAADHFANPTTAPNQLWQTDFTSANQFGCHRASA
jgi:hypothetical protein